MKYKLTKKRGNDIISSRRESGCIMAYESKFKREDIDELFEAILTLKDQASTATISRINKCLVYGADGYKRVLERLNEKDDGQ